MRSAPAGLYGAPSGEEHVAVRAPARRPSPRPASSPATVGAAPSRCPPRDQLADQRRRAARAVQRLGDVAPARATGWRSPACATRARSARPASARRPPRARSASRCSTPLVEPPLAATPAIALQQRRGGRGTRARSGPRRRARPRARPARAAAAAFASRSSAGISPSPGSASPRQSIATAIVFAVNWPAHVPAPGHATRSISSSSARSSSPRSCARDRLPHVEDRQLAVAAAARPAAGRCRAARAGLSTRASAISAAGVVLSQPTMHSERVEVVRDGTSARSSRRSPRARSATRASRACPATGCRRPRSC